MSPWMLEDSDSDLFMLDGDGRDSDLFADQDWGDDALELENIFSDVIGTIGKIAAAPVNLVAKVLPKPIREPFKAISDPFGTAMKFAKGKSPARLATAALTGGMSEAARAATGKGGLFGTKSPFSSINKALGGVREAVSDAKTRAAITGAASSGNKDELLAMMDKLIQRPRLAAKTTTPKIQARGDSGTTKGQDQLVQMVADAVSKKLGPGLTDINAKLRLAENQRTATSEHNAINNETAFRRKVLSDLVRISATLPAGHPTQVRIRKIGLMSGLI